MLTHRISLADESGQTMAEYAVVLGVIAVTIFVALGLLTGAVETSITNAANLIRSL